MNLISFKKFQFNLFSWKSELDQISVPRVQTIGLNRTLNTTKVKEVGRSTNEGVVGHAKGTPNVTSDVNLKEVGHFELFQYLAGKNETSLELSDFGTNRVDAVAYLSDDDDVVLGSKWFPNQRVSGFSISTKDPDSDVEKTINLVGEDNKILQGDNKYFIFKSHVVETADLDSNNAVTITVGSPAPVANPDYTASNNEPQYILQVTRDRAGTVSKLLVTEYSFAAGDLVVKSCEAGDIIKYAYSATTLGSEVTWADNDALPTSVKADCVDLYLYIPQTNKPGAPDYQYKVQSATVDVKFDRLDLKEIGNSEVVSTAIKSKTVTITLNRFAVSNAMEEIMRGVEADYGIIDIRKFVENAKFVMKIYSDNTKGTFLMGLKATELAMSSLKDSIGVDDYTQVEDVLEGEALLITNSEAALLDA